jgi:hypothetical protein
VKSGCSKIALIVIPALEISLPLIFKDWKFDPVVQAQFTAAKG